MRPCVDFRGGRGKCFERALLLGGVLIPRLWKDIDMFAAWIFIVTGRVDVEMA